MKACVINISYCNWKHGLTFKKEWDSWMNLLVLTRRLIKKEKFVIPSGWDITKSRPRDRVSAIPNFGDNLISYKNTMFLPVIIDFGKCITPQEAQRTIISKEKQKVHTTSKIQTYCSWRWCSHPSVLTCKQNLRPWPSVRTDYQQHKLQVTSFT